MPKRRPWTKERGVYYVYILLSPLDGEPMYVGIAANPAKRLREHQRDDTSAARGSMRVYSPSGRWRSDAEMVVVGKFNKRDNALNMERSLIKSISDRRGMWLLNRTHHDLRALFYKCNPDITPRKLRESGETDAPALIEEYTYVPDPTYSPHFDD